MRLLTGIFASLIASALLWSPLMGQYHYKKVYRPDANVFSNVSYLTGRGIICTDMPGKEVAIAGAIAGADNTGYIQSAFLMQTNDEGEVQSMSYYTDTASFLQSGPRTFGLCHDGSTGYYISTGSNDNQIVVRTDNNGKMLWATDVNHHDFYGVVCEGDQVTLLGQDESMVGGHDYSAIQVDSSGTTIDGALFGSTNFDIPQAIASLSDGYVLGGQSYASPRGIMLIKSSPELNFIWGDIFQLPGRQLYMQSMATTEDAILCTGWVTGPPIGNSDSVFVAKFDTAGNALWCRLFGSDSLKVVNANAIAADPALNTILVGGNFDATGYRNSFVMRLDNNGDLLWAQDYSDRDTSLEESVEDIAISMDGNSFYAVGQHIYIDINFFTTHALFAIHAPIADGGLPCDTPLVFGHRDVSLVTGDLVFPYPPSNLPTNPYTYRQGYGAMEDSLRCDVLASKAEPLPRTNAFEVVNPASGELLVTCLADWEGGMLELHDLGGRMVHREEVQGGFQKVRIPAQNWAEGLYILRLKGQSGSIQSRKVILRNP